MNLDKIQSNYEKRRKARYKRKGSNLYVINKGDKGIIDANIVKYERRGK